MIMNTADVSEQTGWGEGQWDAVTHLLSHIISLSFRLKRNMSEVDYSRATVVQEVEKSLSNQKCVSAIPCRSGLEQDTEPLIAPDVQCAISVNVKCKICIHCKSHICKSLWIKASAKCKCKCKQGYEFQDHGEHPGCAGQHVV